MAVTVICVGKLREKYFADAADEYLKALETINGILERFPVENWK